jgi:predicted Zn-dependent protease
VARLPSGEVLKLDLRRADFQRGGPASDEFVYASQGPEGPTFITSDVVLHQATMLAWHADHDTEARPAVRPSTGQARHAKRAHLSRFQLAALVIALAVVSALVAAALLVGPLAWVGLRLVPRSADERIGSEAFAHVVGRIGVLREQSALRAPVEAVLDRVTAAVPNNPFHFRIAICDSPMLNAFALPGGQLVITTRLLAALDSAEELAAVLAHEVNHVLGRHSMEMTIRASGLRFLVHIASGGKLGAGVAMGVWSAIGVMGYSRQKESEADRLAVHLLANANLAPQALLPMLAKLRAEEERHQDADANAGAPEKASTQRILEKFRTHPAIAQRIADVESEIAHLPAVTPQALEVDFAALAAAARGPQAPTDPGP